MNTEIVSLAFVEPNPGEDAECERIMRELRALCAQKKYSRDDLYRDPTDPRLIVLMRHWASAETRQQATEDPEIHRLWRELSHICKVRQVHEELRPIE